MITFFISLLILFLGYKLYGTYLDKKFASDNRTTPAISHNDGIDYIPMPTWKVFLIQLLNIAGLGPIFGAIIGAIWGPIICLWIVFGTIFAGAVHDYLSGMLSERNNGISIAEVIGKYLGNFMQNIMRLFSIILIMMVGVVFTIGPAELLSLLTPKYLDKTFWLIIILIYYFLSNFLPINKLVSKIYPIFGISLLIMALLIGYTTLYNDILGKSYTPELWNNFKNMHFDKISIFPMMFISVACGAISGFHATQSPMMARCIKSEKDGKKVFYGAMCIESVIALIWAFASATFFYDPQNEAFLQTRVLNINGKEEIIHFVGNSSAVYGISMSLLGKIGGIFAILGVIICPITSGDSSFRTTRFSIAELLKIDQKNILKRFLLTFVILSVGYLISLCDYSIIWRYFSWANQTLATIVLWCGAVFLKKKHHNLIWLIAGLPGTFMSCISLSYILQAKEGLSINASMANSISILFSIMIFLYFCLKIKNNDRK